MANDTPKDDVGYKKPPRSAQFPPGVSGNKNGRPKGSRNFDTTLRKELQEKIPVTENGKRKKVTKREAIAKQLINRAASGDPRAISIILNAAREFEDRTTGASPVSALQSPEDKKILEGLRRRLGLDGHEQASGDSDGMAMPSATPAPQPRTDGKASEGGGTNE